MTWPMARGTGLQAGNLVLVREGSLERREPIGRGVVVGVGLLIGREEPGFSPDGYEQWTLTLAPPPNHIAEIRWVLGRDDTGWGRASPALAVPLPAVAPPRRGSPLLYPIAAVERFLDWLDGPDA